MDIKHEKVKSRGIKYFIKVDQREVGRAFLYLLWNDYRSKYFGFLEDVYVDENFRGQGHGKKLVKEVIKIAKQNSCYKIVATSRFNKNKVHSLYESLGFEKFGFEFKLYLEKME